ncbi:MAG: hypothetical protein E7290_11940 [Lachnospiraceae bacterium]|nr:hypothetical protein [Lachnospiraceae bacterium]
MELFLDEVRVLVYTIICLECLLQFVSGSSYQKYLKMFTGLLVVCLCGSVVFSAVSSIQNYKLEMKSFEELWEEHWGAEIY